MWEKRRNSRILRQVLQKSQIWKDASMTMLREGAVGIESPRYWKGLRSAGTCPQKLFAIRDSQLERLLAGDGREVQGVGLQIGAIKTELVAYRFTRDSAK